jgi:hypothetical protein
MLKGNVSDGEAGRYLDPEGNEVNREGRMGEGPVLQAGSKISKSSAAEEGAAPPWSNQEDWKKSPA